MKLTAQDRRAMEMTCNCIRNCKHYHTIPAPYFPLLIRMYHELKAAGMIEWEPGAEFDVPPYR